MIRIFGQYYSPMKMLLILGESILIFCALFLASLLLIAEGIGASELLGTVGTKILLVILVTQFSLYFNDLYERYTKIGIADVVSRVLQSVGMASIVLAFLYSLMPSTMIGKHVFLGSLVLLVLIPVSWRLVYAYVIQQGLFMGNTIILGDGELAKDIFNEMTNKYDIAYQIKCIVAQKNGTSRWRFKGVPIRRGFKTLCDLAKAEEVRNIIVALDQRRGVMPYRELLNCRLKGIKIIDGENFYERISGKILVEKLNPSWLIFSDGFMKSRLSWHVKRLVDLILAAVMFAVVFPFMVLIAIAIKIDSQGAVLFSQERVGENGRAFTLIKFRSMRMDAEEKSGPVWASENDTRITKVGRVIRKLRVDELPQLWNVLKGDMSLVGPRPERAYFVNELKKVIPYYEERLCVRPGVTGWAQVKYPYGACRKDAIEKLKYDLYYIKNMSLMMDVMVIFHTIKIVFLGRGSR